MREFLDRLMLFMACWAVLFGGALMWTWSVDAERGRMFAGSFICSAGLSYFLRSWWDNRK